MKRIRFNPGPAHARGGRPARRSLVQPRPWRPDRGHSRREHQAVDDIALVPEEDGYLGAIWSARGVTVNRLDLCPYAMTAEEITDLLELRV